MACYDGSGNLLGGTGATTSVTSVVATSSSVATLTFSGPTTATCLISTGSMGPIGPTGSTGLTGAAGTTGPAGATGPAGPTGPQGATGPGGSGSGTVNSGSTGQLAYYASGGTALTGGSLTGDVTNSGLAMSLATKLRTVKVIAYEVGAENATAALVTADFTSHAIGVNDGNAKTLTEASCISDAGSQSVTVKVGATTLFSITCAAPGAYSRGTTDGSTGYIVAASMGSTAVAAGAQLDLSGTANGTTKDVKLHAYGTVN